MSDLFQAIETDWEGAGGSASSAPMAAGIALAESSGNAAAANPSDPAGGSYGLWQINGVHAPGATATPQWIAQIENPGSNAAEAVALSGDGNNWDPWKDDRLWDQWVAAGSPPDPSASAVESWLSAAGAPTGSNPATTATLTSLDWNPLNGFGIPSTIAGGIASAAAAPVKDVATSVEHFAAKALLVLVGLAIAGYGVISLVSPGHKPADVVEDVAPALAEGAAA